MGGHWALVIGPIVLSEMWMPYLGNGVSMTFTRLVLTHVPSRMGVCQALINSNGPIVGQIILTAWLSLTYSGGEILWQGAPQMAFAGLAALNTVLVAWALCNYDRMRPRQADNDLNQPESMTRQLSKLSFGDCPLNPGADEVSRALCSLDLPD